MILFGSIETISDLRTRIKVSSSAIGSFIEIMKENYYMEFELLILGDDKNLRTIANEVIRRSITPMNLRIDLTFNKTTKEYTLEDQRSLIIMSSHEDFKFLFNFNESYKSIYFLQYCLYATEDDLFYSPQNIMQNLRLFNLAHTYNGNMTLIGTEKVSQNSCTPITRSINTFLTSEMKWNTTNFIPQYKNFYGCDLQICCVPMLVVGSWFVRSYKYDNGEIITEGTSTSLLPLLKQQMNIGEFKTIYLNKSGNSIEEDCDLLLFYHQVIYLSEEKSLKPNLSVMNRFAETYPICYQDFIVTVTKGLAYTPMEKLILPFDLETWIMIIVTFAIGFLTIFIIYRCDRYVQRFVFGTFVRDPSLTLTSIFFGIGVTRLPTRNFSRYLLMVFTLYCLIIRTAYQGKMYEFLNKDIRRPTAKTMDDIAHMKIPIMHEINRYGDPNSYVSQTPILDR
jgi:hypothetical protein